MSADPAPARARAAAASIDMAPVLLLLIGALVVATVTAWPWWVPLVLVGAAAAWCLLLWRSAATDGRPPGKRLFGLAEVTDAVGAPAGPEPGLGHSPASAPAAGRAEAITTVPSPGRALARLALRGALSLVTVGVAGLSYRWDPAGRQRAWWDRALGTTVIEGRPAGHPDDDLARRWAPPNVEPHDGDPPSDRSSGPPAPPLGPAVALPAAIAPRPVSPERSSATVAQAPIGTPPDITRRVSTPAVPAPVAEPGVGVPPGATSGEFGPAGPAPAVRGGWVPGRDVIDPPPAPPFLAPPLIGGPARSVPHGASGADRGGAGSADASPGLITGIGPTGRLTGSVGRPRHRAREQTPGRTEPAGARLIWDTGRNVTVSGRVLIGRDPAPAAGEAVDQLIPVTTDSMGVSKTHLLVEVGVAGITVTDRRSTNGVRVVRANGSVVRCPPGAPVAVAGGDAVHFGGRFITIAG